MSHGVNLESKATQFYARTNATNYATNGYPSRIPTTLPPYQQVPTGGVAGDGIIEWGANKSGIYGVDSSYTIMLLPYGVGADDTTFTFQVLGWRSTAFGVGQPLWVPVEIFEAKATLSATVGVANSDLGVTQAFADAIVIVSGGPTLQNAVAPNTIPPIVPDFAIFSNPADTVGFLIVRGLGFPFLEVIYNTTGSATSCNALWAAL